LESLQPANRHTFIQPTAAISDDSLAIVKHTLEAFAGQVADDQQRKLQESRKRKRGAEDLEVLKIRKVYVDGFETNQVWQQAKRIIGSVLKHADATLEELQDSNQIALGDVSGSESVPEEDEDELELGSEDDLEAGEPDSIEHPDGVEDLSDIDSPEGEQEEEEEWEDAPEGSDGEDDGEEQEEEEEEAEEYTEDPDGLNDGFFSLDDFNKQSQWFEEQDAKGDPNTDAASDDENIDWTTDPLAPSKATGKSQSRKTDNDKFLNDGEADGDEEDDDDDDGPTFGDMALDAPEGDSEDEAMQGALEDGLEDGAMDFNANDVFYKDFFAPPKRKYNSDKPRKAKRSEPEQPAEGDVNRAMAAVRRDLFEDESEHEDSEDVLSDVSAGDPRSRRSAHERRQAKLAEEIRKLEAASVAKREWTLSGEAAAVDRPMNSLLEQDLDFEHVGKPVPVITPEVTEGIEDLIKRRILAQEFDEVLRRRPGTESVPNGTRRGLLEEVDDTKGKSLAEVYEEEHAKQVDPEGHASKSYEKLKKEEREVEAMWRDVSARLDALSSWQYRPRPVEPTLSVVADVATVSMEDAQPTTAQGVVGEQSRMAPQEIYSASGKTAAKGEVVSRSGLPMAKQEMSREDKQRRRRREKERVRKAGGVGEGKTLSKRAKMQKETMADLKKGGVKVINRKGEVTDVDGNKVKAAKAKTSGSFKL
jgi:U3 small nucleolar RNA-associated protein MPP10